MHGVLKRALNFSRITRDVLFEYKTLENSYCPCYSVEANSTSMVTKYVYTGTTFVCQTTCDEETKETDIQIKKQITRYMRCHEDRCCVR